MCCDVCLLHVSNNFKDMFKLSFLKVLPFVSSRAAQQFQNWISSHMHRTIQFFLLIVPGTFEALSVWSIQLWLMGQPFAHFPQQLKYLSVYPSGLWSGGACCRSRVGGIQRNFTIWARTWAKLRISTSWNLHHSRPGLSLPAAFLWPSLWFCCWA